MKRANQILLFNLAVFIFFGCSSNDEEAAPPVPQVLDEVESLDGRQVGELKALVDFSGIPELQALKDYLQYDVDYYKVTYKTMYLGHEIVASGLVTFPSTSEAVPILSFQNGTNTKDADAPTNDAFTFTALSSLASAGYVIVIPDYIGFGSSSNEIPPYHQKEYTASAVIDLMKAASELATDEGYNFNGEVLLAGYSEGGYATMATHKAMEEEPPEGLELIASAPASGGYDVKGFQEYLFGLENYNNPHYLAFVTLSYKTVYELDLPLSDFFQEPYASSIPDLFDGSMSGGQIDAALTTQMADLLQPEALENFDSSPKFTPFVDALNDNNLTDWVPSTPMIMYHGSADITVPYQNSLDTYQKLIAGGASADVVSFVTLEGANHSTGFYPYIEDVITRFDLLK